jgi:hypothetical protein
VSAFDLPEHAGSIICWAADESDLPEVMRQSHDVPIETLGPRRRGGVTWVTFRGIQALQFLATAESLDTDPALLASYEQIRASLAEVGGIVVLAWAPAEP